MIENGYNAFISYEHEQSSKIAKSLQIALQSFAKPWIKGRALRVFRDESNLSANPDIWQAIEEAIKNTEYFILLASPKAAKSEWVLKELESFLKNHHSSKVLIVQVDGSIKWDNELSDFDWTVTDAIPKLKKSIFSNEPLYIDLTFAKKIENLTLSNKNFIDSIASLTSTIRDIPKDYLLGEHIANERQAISTQRIYITMRCIAGFGFATIFPWLGLVLEIQEQFVLLLGLPIIGAIGGVMSGQKVRGMIGFFLGYLILVPFYSYGSQKPFNYEFLDSTIYFLISLFGFALTGAIGGLISGKKLWRVGLLSFSIGGICLGMCWLTFKGLRPDDSNLIISFGQWTIHRPVTAIESANEMNGFWWRDPWFYLPLFIANLVSGSIFGWLSSKVSISKYYK